MYASIKIGLNLGGFTTEPISSCSLVQNTVHTLVGYCPYAGWILPIRWLDTAHTLVGYCPYAGWISVGIDMDTPKSWVKIKFMNITSYQFRY